MTIPLLAVATIVLSNSFGRAEVDLHGARVRSYVPFGGREVLCPVAEPDATGWSAGGIPVCWPWFFDRGPAGAGLHGSARSSDFRVVGISGDSAELGLADGSLLLRVRVELGRRLVVTMTTENAGTETAYVTEGLHAYFAVADVGSAVLEGLDGVRCTTKRSGEPKVCVSGPRVPLSGANDIFDVKSGTFVIDDPVGGRRIKLEMSGMGELTAWNGRSCPRGAACVEPIILREPLALAPGARHEMKMSVEATSR